MNDCVNMKTYVANVNTLYKVGKGIYSTDKKVLQEKLQKEKAKNSNCSSADEQMVIYNKIEEYFEEDEKKEEETEEVPKKKQHFDRRYAITFGEVSVLHIGGKEIGKKRNSGFSVQELKNIKKNLDKKSVTSELYMLSDELPENLREENEAATLVIRNAADYILEDDGVY